MARITVTHRIASPPTRVWPHLADLASHAEWMADAEAIVFTTDQTSGVGTLMEVPARVGPFRTLDVIEVTGWVEGSSISVRHIGVVSGDGTLALRPEGEGTLVTWSEVLRFPWYLGGPLGAYLAKPILRWIWRGNLRRFAAIVTAATHD